MVEVLAVCPPGVTAAIKDDAVARYPDEACGFVTPHGYVPLANIAADPARSFEVLAGAWLEHAVVAVVHSHPDGPDAPSAADMRGQIDSAVPWGLVVTDGVGARDPWFWGGGVADGVPLKRRRFRHGPTGTDGCGDCYALVRDWYRVERGVALPEFPRDDDWWDEAGDLYREGFAAAGFAHVGEPRAMARDLAVGDVLLFQIRADIPNHAGVYVGGGLMIHHPAAWGDGRGRNASLSRVEPAARWITGHGTHVLRYIGGG